jgi:F-box protein 21
MFEDELELHSDPSSVRVDHPRLGIHFEKFDGRRFVPNAKKKSHFPQDEAAVISLIRN